MDEPRIIDAEFTVISGPTPAPPKLQGSQTAKPEPIDARFKPTRIKGRARDTMFMTDEVYEQWRKQPLWKRRRLTMDWNVFWATAAVSIAIGLGKLLHPQ